jgi:hypothetical protein
MDVRRVGAPVAALVIGAVVTVLLGAADSPLAWAAVVLVAVVVGVIAAVATVPLLVARILVGLGVLLALAAIVFAIVDAVRGRRSDTSTLVLVLVAGIGALFVVVGLLGGTRRPLRATEDRIAAGAAVLGLVAAAISVAVLPFSPLLRGVVFDSADQAPELVLRTPDGVRTGDVLVAQVYHRGGGDIAVPAGWERLVSTPVSPGAADTVELFTSRSTGDERVPVSFATAVPGDKIGGIVAWSHVDAATVAAQGNGPAAPITAGGLEAGAQAPLLYFTSLAGASGVTAPDGLDAAWQARSDGVFKGSVALLVRAPQDAGPAAPVSLTPAPGATGPWAMQVVALQPE